MPWKVLTLVPYERELIDISLLNLEEKNWLNNYHKNVKKIISPYLNNGKKWLKIQCKKIKKNIFNFTIIYGSTRKNRVGIRFVYYLANQIKLKRT